MQEVLNLPDPKKLINTMFNENIPEIKGTISDWLQEEMNHLKESRQWPKDKIFMTFVNALLARQSYEGWFDKVLHWLNEDIKTIDDLPSSEEISRKLEEFGYRWHPQGGQVIVEAKKKFLQEYSENWNHYFDLADKRYMNDFPDDDFLKIKNVGYKVRDLALSQFSPKYIAIDEHVVEVLKRTGLICYAYFLGLELTTDQTKEKDYLELRSLCVHLSELADIEPRELDRLFWIHGKHICKGRNKKCDLCAVNNMCLTYDKKKVSSPKN